MITNDDKEIWETLFKNKKSGQDGVISESTGCPDIERLISSEDNEDRESYRSKTIPPDDDKFFGWHNKKKEFLGKRGDIVVDSATGGRGAIVNVRDYEVDLWSPDRTWTAKIKDLVSDEDQEGENIDVTEGGGTDAGEFEAEDKTGYG